MNKLEETGYKLELVGRRLQDDAARIRLIQHSRPSAVLAGLFLRACWATVLQGLGVVAFARGSYWACVTAFAIQFLWASNTRIINDNRSRWSKMAYGCGGCVGAAVALWLGWKR